MRLLGTLQELGLDGFVSVQWWAVNFLSAVVIAVVGAVTQTWWVLAFGVILAPWAGLMTRKRFKEALAERSRGD